LRIDIIDGMGWIGGFGVKNGEVEKKVAKKFGHVEKRL
jgi:hypothetical protein